MDFSEGYILMVADVPINVWIRSTAFVICHLAQHLEHLRHHFGLCNLPANDLVAVE